MIRIDRNIDTFALLDIDSLEGAEIDGLSLHRAVFSGREMTNATIKNSFLTGSYSGWAEMRGMRFEDCNLATSLMRNAHLKSASLDGFALDRQHPRKSWLNDFVSTTSL
tara:strand:+ start:61 stop:387 length:327 start_codon:yes stop_codon:yes gene_type:complete